ncbi:hypothetical protein BDK51DRAFT_26971, partial [Blyttiomyces helicus]
MSATPFLPQGWSTQRSADGRDYYVSPQGTSQWNHPNPFSPPSAFPTPATAAPVPDATAPSPVASAPSSDLFDTPPPPYDDSDDFVVTTQSPLAFPTPIATPVAARVPASTTTVWPKGTAPPQSVPRVPRALTANDEAYARKLLQEEEDLAVARRLQEAEDASAASESAARAQRSPQSP